MAKIKKDTNYRIVARGEILYTAETKEEAVRKAKKASKEIDDMVCILTYVNVAAVYPGSLKSELMFELRHYC